MEIRDIPLRDLVHAWTKNSRIGFNFRAGYYAGRGVNTGDLNGEVLEGIYQGLLKDVSKDAAANYVRFVNKLNDLSATAFITAFERFWSGNCEVDVEQHENDGITLDAHGDALQGQAFAMMADVLSGRRGSAEERQIDSYRVKGLFIEKHIDLIPEAERVTVTHGERMYARRLGRVL